MENCPITISLDKEVHHFEVGEYAHHGDDKCKFRVYENGQILLLISLLVDVAASITNSFVK